MFSERKTIGLGICYRMSWEVVILSVVFIPRALFDIFSKRTKMGCYGCESLSLAFSLLVMHLCIFDYWKNEMIDLGNRDVYISIGIWNSFLGYFFSFVFFHPFYVENWDQWTEPYRIWSKFPLALQILKLFDGYKFLGRVLGDVFGILSNECKCCTQFSNLPKAVVALAYHLEIE